MMKNTKEQQLETIKDVARTHLHIQTLETANSDSLDFHDLAVWSVREALEAAYEAGRKAERS